MVFRLDRESRLPYPAQVQRQAVAHVVAGRLQAGDRLPSVRELAQRLAISRTTAERIQEALGEAMAIEVRPRSGAFVAGPDSAEGPSTTLALTHAHAIHDLIQDVLDRAGRLGIDAARLGQLLRLVELERQGKLPETLKSVPVVATADAFECMARSLPAGFPVRLVRVPPDATPDALPTGSSYLLCGYYLRAVARRMADRIGSALLYVRYNTRLLDEFMDIPPGQTRVFVTRDADNAETTRAFMASAYPEVPLQRYTVLAVREFLEDEASLNSSSLVWSTITAVPELEGRIPASRLRVHHPTLAEDFVDELRCLALLG